MELKSDYEKIVLKRCGVIDPEKIEDYLENDGYEALRKALTQMSPGDVISVIKDSGLRGRGGSAFPTGLKWNIAADAQADQKYVICNADEGEPGTFKDRIIMEGDPHSILEGMVIAGYAMGASEGYIYIRGEYATSINHLELAIRQAREKGFLGKNILDSAFGFDIFIRTGAGAYICGEETALIESIEGFRGQPRSKPPFPSAEGLWKKPTVVNNVETLANVPAIILNSAEWYKKFGTEGSSGTKIFTLIGNVENKGYVEAPLGVSMRELIFECARGVKEGNELKFVQIGGTAGFCLPSTMIDTPLDFDSLTSIGAGLGSGAILVVGKKNGCAVNLAKSFARFFYHESCGKCVPCRVGIKRMYEILSRLVQGDGKAEDITHLFSLGKVLKAASLCGLGLSAPNSILDTLKHFRQEYEEHIQGKCSAEICF